jgi:hypothetical protein
MRKFLVISIPIVTLAFFVLIMLSANFLKKPFGTDDNVPGLVQAVTNNIKEEKWEDASRNTEKLNEAWAKVVRRVQFSAERDEINSFTMNVARLRGAIMAKDKSDSLTELSEALEHWKEIGR